jgi:Domain of unknown function (DUF4145)
MTSWQNVGQIPSQRWTCGYCGGDVAANVGWTRVTHDQRIQGVSCWLAICPGCDLPSIIELSGDALPRPLFGSPVAHLPEDVQRLYDEARRSMQADAPTAASMAARKLLMTVAHTNGAEAGQSFLAYVEWLLQNGFITPPMRRWVDEIRELGNDANHEIDLMSVAAATELLSFVEMLLRVIYEYPARAQQSSEDRTARSRSS